MAALGKESSIYGMYGHAAPATLVGHVIRMSPNRLPRRLLYSELQEGRRSRGGQMKRFSDNVKLLLKKCQIPPSQLEVLAADRRV